MTYRNDFVACIKVNGKVLREQNSTVAIPFGSDYSILLKNLKSVRAIAEITIDGESATDNQKLIIPANSEVSLERYLRAGKFSSGNKLKFIERTDSIEQHRGIKADDGIVRIEFWAESPWTMTVSNNWVNTIANTQPNSPFWPTETPWKINTVQPSYNLGSITTDNTVWSTTTATASSNTKNCTSDVKNVLRSTSFNCCTEKTPGITVPGGYSSQQFTVGAWFPTETTSTVLTFQLVGTNGDEPILQPVTVQTKPVCKICGRTNRATNKFCSECGSSLILF